MPAIRAAIVGSSIITAISSPSAPQKKNCRQDSSTALSLSTKQLTATIWAAKPAALARVSQSPAVAPLRPPFRLINANPIIAIAMQKTVRLFALLPTNTLNSGVNTMYIEEMNPDFPTLTVSRPTCGVAVPPWCVSPC